LPPSCVVFTAISCHPSASRTIPYRSASHRPLAALHLDHPDTPSHATRTLSNAGF